MKIPLQTNTNDCGVFSVQPILVQLGLTWICWTHLALLNTPSSYHTVASSLGAPGPADQAATCWTRLDLLDALGQLGHRTRQAGRNRWSFRI